MEEVITTTEDKTSGRDSEIPTMVANSQQAESREIISGTVMANSHNRCQPHGLGSDIPETFSSGNLVTDGIFTTDKYPRDQGHSASTSGMGRHIRRPSSKDTVRQCHSSGICQQAGRHKKQKSKPRSDPDSGVGRKYGHTDLSNTHSRNRQCRSRLPQQTPAGPRRMESVNGSVSATDQDMGRTGNRLDGVKAKQKGSKVFCKVQRSPSGGSRRHDSSLAIQTSLRVSSSSHVTAGTAKDHQRTSHSDPSGTLLAQEILVFKSTRSITGTSDSTSIIPSSTCSGTTLSSQSSAIRLNGMALEAAILRHKGFSEEVILTMIKARKPTTSKIYNRTWECYRAWCEKEELLFPEFRLAWVLQFLQEGLQKGLKLGSLKAQVSALSVLFQERLALKDDVRTFLQGVSRVSPPFRHPVPPWDLNLVLSVLLDAPFEPLKEVGMEFLTWKTVFLIAISSARRISELSALSCAEPFLNFHEDRAVLRTVPEFLPKVVSSFHINTEIVLPSFCNNPKNEKEARLHRLDVVRTLKVYVSRARPIRKTETLFIIPSGARKGLPATKTTIARWIKETVRRAYLVRKKVPPIKLRAHSTRAIGASWAHRNAATAEQVCRAATWSSPHTFTKFYHFNTYLSAEAAFGRKVLQAVVF
uniref:Tyr recombinase domain-containing protein n=1 Tax=Xenopus tropicalis TaxID=8364 RepID=A0A803JL00_XENTR